MTSPPNGLALSGIPAGAEVNLGIVIDGWVRAILAGLAQLLFSSRRLPGLLTAFGLAAYSPWLLLGALTGTVIGTIIERWATGLDHRLWRDGVGGINPAILGVLGSGFFAAPDERVAILILLCVICTAVAAIMRKAIGKIGLFAFSAPAYATTVAASLFLVGPGHWWWAGIGPAAFVPAGPWVMIACLVGAMAWESPAAAGWAVCASLLFYNFTLSLGMATADSFGLWGIVIPLCAFGAQRIFAGRSPAAPKIATVAAFLGGIIWWLWHLAEVDRIASPLFAPTILSLWAMMLVHDLRLKRKKRAGIRPLVLQSGFAFAILKLWRSRLVGRPVLVATGSTPVEDAILRDVIGAGLDFRTSMLETRAGRRRLWEASDLLRGAVEAPSFDFYPALVFAGGCIGQGPSGLNRFDLAGRADRIRCLGCGSISPAPPVGLWRRLELTCSQCAGQVVPDIRRLIPLEPAKIKAALDAASPQRATCIVLPGALESPAAPALLEKIGQAKWGVIQILERPGDALPDAVTIICQELRVIRLFSLLGCVRRRPYRAS